MHTEPNSTRTLGATIDLTDDEILAVYHRHTTETYAEDDPRWLKLVEKQRKKQGKLQKTDPRTTYEAEYREVATALERDGEIPGSEALLYTQHTLVAEIVKLARQYDLPVVDNIRLQEQLPNRLGSAVHLTEEANGKLAAELYPVVRAIVDRTQ